MSNTYGVVEVILRETGEKRLIKWSRFNPEIHKQIGDIHEKEYTMVYNQPVHLQLDDLGKTLAKVQAEKEQKAALEQNDNSAIKLENNVVENKEEIEENVFDASVELPIEEVEKLKIFQLRAYAKHRGIKVSNKSTKIDLMAQVRSLPII